MPKKIPNTIAVIAAECSVNEELRALNGICAEAKKMGWRVFIFNAQNNFNTGTNPELGTNIYKLLDYETISGVLIAQNVMNTQTAAKEIINQCKKHKVPVLSVGYKTDLCPCYVFSSSDVLDQIVSHVIEKHSCKTLNLVAGIKGNAFSEQRIEAFRKAVKKHGLEFDERRLFYGEFWEGPTKAEMRDFFESGLSMPDAFVCCNDAMAMAVCQELTDHGYRVPEDVIVTGYDGIEFEQYHSPRLTTAKCDIELLGRESFKSLVSAIKGNKLPKIQTIEPTVIYSQSCGCNSSTALSQNNFAIKALSNFGNYRHRTSMLYKFATLTSELKKIDDIKPLLPNNDFYGKDCWIMLNQNFLQNKDDEFSKENPFSEKMDCFWNVISDTHFPHEPIKRSEYLPDLKKIFKEGLTNLVFLDLYFGGDSIGYMAVPLVDRNPSFDLSAMERFAQSFSQCCSLIKNRSRLEYMNTHDQLTNTLNRRGFYAEIEAQIKKVSSENDSSTSLIIHSIDMNELKYINDTFGHNEGDFAIKSLSTAIDSAGDKNIIVARFGGDEFVAAEITRGNTGKIILDFRNKMHAFLDNVNKKSKKPFKVSASCGSFTTPLPLQLRIDQIIAQADALMYQEKTEGKRRDKVRMSER